MRVLIITGTFVVALLNVGIAHAFDAGDKVSLTTSEGEIPVHASQGISGVSFRFKSGSTAEVLYGDPDSGWYLVKGDVVSGGREYGWITDEFIAGLASEESDAAEESAEAEMTEEGVAAEVPADTEMTEEGVAAEVPADTETPEESAATEAPAEAEMEDEGAAADEPAESESTGESATGEEMADPEVGEADMTEPMVESATGEGAPSDH